MSAKLPGWAELPALSQSAAADLRSNCAFSTEPLQQAMPDDEWRCCDALIGVAEAEVIPAAPRRCRRSCVVIRRQSRLIQSMPFCTGVAGDRSHPDTQLFPSSAGHGETRFVFFADAQFAGDFLGGHAGGDPAQDFRLSVGQGLCPGHLTPSRWRRGGEK